MADSGEARVMLLQVVELLLLRVLLLLLLLLLLALQVEQLLRLLWSELCVGIDDEATHLRRLLCSMERQLLLLLGVDEQLGRQQHLLHEKRVHHHRLLHLLLLLLLVLLTRVRARCIVGVGGSSGLGGNVQRGVGVELLVVELSEVQRILSWGHRADAGTTNVPSRVVRRIQSSERARGGVADEVEAALVDWRLAVADAVAHSE